MREESEQFRILLPIQSVFQVYDYVGKIVKTRIDFLGELFNPKALNNTLQLLEDLELIEIKDNLFHKNTMYDENEFKHIFIEKLLDKKRKTLFTCFQNKHHFDIKTQRMFCYKNSISMKYAGLVMLLDSCEMIQSEGERWILINNKLKTTIVSEEKKTRITLEELENKLILQKKLGLEAEEYVLQYEKEKLEYVGINKEPIQISFIDVSAGFDILSYDKFGENKYIEVKSCDTKYNFYFSVNEVETAKKYGNKYWLYLYNRVNHTIKEICNPYQEIVFKQSEEWAVEVDGYHIHMI